MYRLDFPTRYVTFECDGCAAQMAFYPFPAALDYGC